MGQIALFSPISHAPDMLCEIWYFHPLTISTRYPSYLCKFWGYVFFLVQFSLRFPGCYEILSIHLEKHVLAASVPSSEDRLSSIHCHIGRLLLHNIPPPFSLFLSNSFNFWNASPLMQCVFGFLCCIFHLLLIFRRYSNFCTCFTLKSLILCPILLFFFLLLLTNRL